MRLWKESKGFDFIISYLLLFVSFKCSRDKNIKKVQANLS
jgi:hypothetical protein